MSGEPAPVVVAEPRLEPPAPAVQTCTGGIVILASEDCPPPPPAANGGGHYGERDDAGTIPPAPERPRPAYRDGSYLEEGGLRATGYRGGRFLATASMGFDIDDLRQRRFALASIRYWQTVNGALTRQALIAILEQCLAEFGEVGPECLAAVRAGDGEFRVVPQDARAEFTHIYRRSCGAGQDQGKCVNDLQRNSVFRSLPRGGLTLGPTKMREKVRTLFTVKIRDPGTIRGQAGSPTEVGYEADADRPGEERRIEVVPYSATMCFVLTAYDPARATIEAQAGAGRKIGPANRICMAANDGTSAIKFEPSWWVTPLTGEDFGMKLVLEHIVGTMKQDYPQEPQPIKIDVEDRWEILDEKIRRATATVKLAIGLAEAIGLFFTAIAGWGIWKWFKRRRSG